MLDFSGRTLGLSAELSVPASAVAPYDAALDTLPVARVERVSGIARLCVVALFAELASEQARLSALQGVLTARLLASHDTAAAEEPADRLLTAEQAAAILGVTKRWVQRRAQRLPFARRLSAHAVRYSESGLRRWMSNRQMRIG
jgi:predicted DNA-binding transcriptional regulator AlpA